MDAFVRVVELVDQSFEEWAAHRVLAMYSASHPSVLRTVLARGPKYFAGTMQETYPIWVDQFTKQVRTQFEYPVVVLMSLSPVESLELIHHILSQRVEEIAIQA